MTYGLRRLNGMCASGTSGPKLLALAHTSLSFKHHTQIDAHTCKAAPWMESRADARPSEGLNRAEVMTPAYRAVSEWVRLSALSLARSHKSGRWGSSRTFSFQTIKDTIVDSVCVSTARRVLCHSNPLVKQDWAEIRLGLLPWLDINKGPRWGCFTVPPHV